LLSKAEANLLRMICELCATDKDQICLRCAELCWKCRFAGELGKAELNAADAQHHQQQGLLRAYALTASTQAPSYQQGGSSALLSGRSSNSSRGSAATQISYNPVRIVGMSATLPNAEEVRREAGFSVAGGSAGNLFL
jgi:hypothetical protein